MGKESVDHDKEPITEMNSEVKETPETVEEVIVDEKEKLKQELQEANDKYLRLFAEFENMRKRHQRERLELIKYAHEEVIINVIGFYEDFERSIIAAKASPAGSDALLKGVEMVFKRIQDLLKTYQVTEIEAQGKPFNHQEHEAMMVEESSDCDDGCVLEVLQKGYKLGDRVVRTAKVKVSKKTES